MSDIKRGLTNTLTKGEFVKRKDVELLLGLLSGDDFEIEIEEKIIPLNSRPDQLYEGLSLGYRRQHKNYNIWFLGKITSGYLYYTGIDHFKMMIENEEIYGIPTEARIVNVNDFPELQYMNEHILYFSTMLRVEGYLKVFLLAITNHGIYLVGDDEGIDNQYLDTTDSNYIPTSINLILGDING